MSSARWRARVFGAFRLESPNGAAVTPVGRKARALLAYLLLTEGPAPRERLAGLLWGDRGAEQARASVRQALYELRALGEGDHPLLRIDRGAVALAHDRLSSDLDALRTLGEGAQATVFADLVGEEPQDLLADLDDVDPGFDAWLSGQRARRRDERQALGLAVAERALAAGDAGGADRLAAALTAADPCDEAAVGLAMRARAALGDRAGLRQVLRRYERALRDDLGLEPSSALVALEAELAAQAPPPQAPPPRDGPSA
ncbi:MAG: hypothetical protein JSS35_04865, partial [Proteobacteria bacterium]|nr:hypothetical protein [Pseudomonadota bacterium]